MYTFAYVTYIPAGNSTLESLKLILVCLFLNKFFITASLTFSVLISRALIKQNRRGWNLIFRLRRKGIIHEWRHFLDVSSRSFSTRPRVIKLMKLPTSSYLPLYSPIIRHLGNTDRHRTRKGQKRGKRERRGERERLTDFFATKETGLRTNGRLSLWRA